MPSVAVIASSLQGLLGNPFLRLPRCLAPRIDKKRKVSFLHKPPYRYFLPLILCRKGKGGRGISGKNEKFFAKSIIIKVL